MWSQSNLSFITLQKNKTNSQKNCVTEVTGCRRGKSGNGRRKENILSNQSAEIYAYYLKLKKIFIRSLFCNNPYSSDKLLHTLRFPPHSPIYLHVLYTNHTILHLKYWPPPLFFTSTPFLSTPIFWYISKTHNTLISI